MRPASSRRFGPFVFLLLTGILTSSAITNAATLATDHLSVEIDESSGALTVVDRASGRTWGPDPWQGAAGLLEAVAAGSTRWHNLSDAASIRVTETDARAARIVFTGAGASAEDPPAWKVTSEIALAPDAAEMTVHVVEVKSAPGATARRLYYPLRPFALRTDVDRGAAVIPYWQGVIIPSHIFPMNGGKFCMWDDAQHGSAAMGELRYYNWDGLVMLWFGVHDDKSAVMAVVPDDGSIGMQWIANYNHYQEEANRLHRRSTYPRILTLTPVWHLASHKPQTGLSYHVLPGGDHVTMAKRYRQIAVAGGLHVSLREKAKANPDVNKLKGALYTGIYGGYPHYVNLPGMAFTFDDLERIVTDMHDNLGLEHAFIHAWGTFSNYAPVMWPISEELGGEAKLKQVVDRVKGYGWLYSSYHSFVSLLDHDPDFNIDLAPKDAQGRPVLRGRWKAVDPRHWADLAKATLPKEIAAIGQNADVTDIAFTGWVDEGGRRLADYLASTGLVLGTERGNEWLVPQYHLLEGMVAAYRTQPILRYSHWAPLFNLVYHDAIVNYGKIQDPNHLVHSGAGDYYVKTLRGMLHGDGPMLFFAPYEYEGVRPYVKFAADFLGPLHERIAFEELEDHLFLSPDFLLQSSRFAGGTQVTVNLGPTPQKLESGEAVPPYGFRIRGPSGKLVQGRFRHDAVVDGRAETFE